MNEPKVVVAYQLAKAKVASRRKRLDHMTALIAGWEMYAMGKRAMDYAIRMGWGKK